MRGAFVGSASGAVSVAAHALGGGAVSPGQSTIALLIAVCAAIGVTVGSLRNRRGIADVMVLLAVGQGVGHTALSMSPEHQHGTHLSSVMLVAHLIAIPVGALLIRGAEIAVVRVLSSLTRAVRALRILLAAPDAAIAVAPADEAPARPRPLLSSGIGTRGPPVPA